MSSIYCRKKKVRRSARRAVFVDSRAQSRLEQREAAQPLGGLDDDLQHRVYELRVSLAAAHHGRLVREGADGLQAALDRHQAELVGELVRFELLKPAPAPLFEEEEAALAHLGERGQSRPAVEEE